MSKRRREKRSARYYCEGYFVGLPRELWQRLVYPLVGLDAMLQTARVSREWRAMLYASVRELSYGTTSLPASYSRCFTKDWLLQLCHLAAFALDCGRMRLPSVLPALAVLTSLRTLTLCQVQNGTNTDTAMVQINKLTQLTALDVNGHHCAGLIDLPALRLLDASYCHHAMLASLDHMTALTYLDLGALRHATVEQLTPLVNLQYLSLDVDERCPCTFLTAMRSLVFLELNNTSYMLPPESLVLSHAQWLQLTALTALSIVGTPVPIATVQAMTQLRSLCIGRGYNDEYAHVPGGRVEQARVAYIARFQGALTLDSLNSELQGTLSHLTRLDFKSQNLFDHDLPARARELGIPAQDLQHWWNAVADFRGWHHALPPNYFAREARASSRFMNGQAFI